MIELSLMACSVNKYYRSWKGRVLISKDGKEFKKNIDLLLGDNQKVFGKIQLNLYLYFKDKRKRDVDNYAKVLIDCLKNRLFEDDDMIYKLYMEKFIGYGEDKICIEIIPLETDELSNKNNKKLIKEQSDKISVKNNTHINNDINNDINDAINHDINDDNST